MWEDPIVAEVDRAREMLAAKFNFDVEAIFADIRQRQVALGERLVPQRTRTEPKSEDPERHSGVLCGPGSLGPYLVIMKTIPSLVFFLASAGFLLPLSAAGPGRPDAEAVELVGKASDYWFNRNWNSYYWREDFTFLLRDEASGKSWRIISREPTPAYTYRMGTTFTGLKVSWEKKPRIKVVGVKKVDRIPAEFYHLKLKEPNLATALIVIVETRPGEWKEFYVNNWFHPWGKKADKVIHRYYAGKPAPYDIYGFARGQSAPFHRKSLARIDMHKTNPSLMFHGRVRATKDHAFGYEIELIDLIGRDVKTGGSVLLFGDAKTIPLLDNRKPKK